MGCKACSNADIFILHPHNKVSDVQRKQMTTVIEPNVTNIALEGNFDDCQAMVKTMFSDQGFLKGRKMVAVNSINWARIMSQIVYYFYCATRVGVNKKNPVTFSVPTGNFGDIYAGYIAKKMGLPISKLIAATNKNDILTRFIKNNDYSTSGLIETLSPSMNIQVSSNFERLLFDAHNNFSDSGKVGKLMAEFEKTKSLKVANDVSKYITDHFDSYSIDDEETCKLIKDLYNETQEVIDPHTVIGVGAGRKYMQSNDYNGEAVITLGTAHPAKFPEAIKKSLGFESDLPNFLSGLMEEKEKMEILPNSIDKVKDFISDHY
jgi:threonine synthase